MNTFSASFIAANSDAFTEMVSLGTLAAQRAMDGKESEGEYERGRKLQTVLKARRSVDLTNPEAEALDGCLGFFTFRNYVPTNRVLIEVENDNMTYENGENMLYENESIMTHTD